MKTPHSILIVRGLCVAALLTMAYPVISADAEGIARSVQERLGHPRKDVCVVLSAPGTDDAPWVVELARATELVVFFQTPEPEEATRARAEGDAKGLLGDRLFVEEGAISAIHIADNLAGAVVYNSRQANGVNREEILRVLHPRGKALIGEEDIVKPYPKGRDVWSHPYHGPDNNPQSEDHQARAPYLTQFLADPKFSPMPEVTVVAGGMIFKAFGHIAHKANQNAVLNTLMGINAYNGTIVWRRKLKEGFMIHRNGMIATEDALYMVDDTSCNIIDPATGATRDKIVIPEGLADGQVWKWMAMEDGILYALIGGPEAKIRTRRSGNPALGHWPWGMWDGHDYKNAETSFGFGRTFVAINPDTKKIVWSHEETEYIDSRGMCMKNGKLHYYAPEKFLASLDVKTAKPRWKTSDPALLKAIGPNGRAQHYVTGYATTTYMKCNDDYILFAGPQRNRLVVVSAKDGRLLWDKREGNLQLVLRTDGFYAAGPKGTGAKYEYATGKVLAKLPNRRACTRATGSLDSIFFRTPGGTVRVDTDSNTAQHIAPMRPPCQDGVIIAEGLLYWGPWMCGCQLSFYGHIALAPAGNFDLNPSSEYPQLEVVPDESQSIRPLRPRAGDWSSYLGDNQRTARSRVALPVNIKSAWNAVIDHDNLPTAPVTAGGLVFIGDRKGVIRAIDGGGAIRWKAYTGGAINFPPAVGHDRLFVGSADGRVYAFEAQTGRLLWRYRVAPAQRWIPVYGKLMSTWPVSGGIVVHEDTVYAAAGIAHYDGTHVVGLDAKTGTVKWHNSQSGVLSEQVNSGVSLQGSLFMRNNELCFLGGGVYQTARYRMDDGTCLNTPYNGVNSRFRTAFYAYYPEYADHLSLHHELPDGKVLSYSASYEGSKHSHLRLVASGDKDASAVWTIENQRYNGFIIGPERLVAVGHDGPERKGPFITAIHLQTGDEIWRRPLPAPAVKGGAAIDDDGRLFVALQNGELQCFDRAGN